MNGYRYALLPEHLDDDVGSVVDVLWPPARQPCKGLDQLPGRLQRNRVDDRVRDELLLHVTTPPRCATRRAGQRAYRALIAWSRTVLHVSLALEHNDNCASLPGSLSRWQVWDSGPCWRKAFTTA